MKSLLSGGEEAIKFQIPIDMRSAFYAMFRQTQQLLSEDWVKEETLESEMTGQEIETWRTTSFLDRVR